MVGSVVLVGDVTFSVVEALRYGVPGLDGSGNALGWWDLCKAVAITVALVIAAGRLRARVLQVIGAVFLIVEIEDHTDIHHAISRQLARTLSTHLSGAVWTPARVQAVSQLLVLTAFALIGFALIWLWQAPVHPAARQARLVLSFLLGTLYVFAGGVDFLGKILSGAFWPAIEEVGERLVMTLSLAYTAVIASVGRRRLTL
jgi:hypothetical protein